MNRRARVSFVLLAAALLVAAFAGQAQARTDDRSKPIVYIHGYDPIWPAGHDCSSYFGSTYNKLKNLGHTGTVATLQYYYGDDNCTYTGDHHGSHSKHYASGHASGSHDRDARIEHLAYHLAWMINDHFGSQPVDIVAHSMGGLIARYMVERIEQKHADFPARLYVEDVLTWGTPHDGTGWGYGCSYTQCYQMRPGSSLVNWLNSNAQNPQATGGSDWTVVGSQDDEIVSDSSAISPAVPHKANILGSMNVAHNDYMHDTSDAMDADVDYTNTLGGLLSRWYDGWHAVRWADQALTYGTW